VNCAGAILMVTTNEAKEQPIPISYYPGSKFYEQISVGGVSMFGLWENWKSDTGGEFYTTLEISKPELTIKPLQRTPWYTASTVLECDPKHLWNEVKNFIAEHVDLSDERLYDVLTAWVFCTWIPERFNVIGYISINAPKSSGKTRLMETLRQLSYRGIKSSDCSNSAMYRIVEKWHPTLFFDESEIYNKGLREDIQGLFNSGYSRGDFIIRVKDPQTDELSFFETYGFKVFAGTETLRDTLESRCIHINMIKNTRPVRFKVDEVSAELLRNKLLWFRFNQLTWLEKNERTTEMPSELSFADGRFSELYSSLVEMCKVIG
jgi:hypothetical protein